MKVRFESSSSLSGSLRVPASKSYTHRAYFTALLTGGGRVHYPLHSDDTDATLSCLEEFSADVDYDRSNRVVRVRADWPPEIRSDELFVQESGTLLRFLLPICTVLQGPASIRLIGEESLSERSNREPVESLREAGFDVDATGEGATVPITCYPGQQPDDDPVGVACSTTSQYLSGWLLALAGLGGGTIRRTTELVSAPYVAMTEDVLREAGSAVTHPDSETYRLNAKVDETFDYDVPGDYSSAAFLLVGAALTDGEVKLAGLREGDRQADRRIVSILRDLGVSIDRKQAGESHLVVTGPADIGGFTVDGSDCPDLAPVLSVLGALGSGKATIENVEHLTNKESDRINRTAEELRKTGVQVETDSGRISIAGTAETPEMVELQAHGDHRLAMAFSLLGTVLGNVTVTGAECVSKSYPDFYDDIESLGAHFVRSESIN